MLISSIVAMSENHCIGDKGNLPWHLPEDLKYFKRITMGKPIIMGRKTFESIKKPLPGRTNIVLTHGQVRHAGVRVAHSIEEAINFATKACQYTESDEIMVVGGANVYRQFQPFVNKIFLTLIHKKFAGDTFFPPLSKSEWQQLSCEQKTAYLEDGNSLSYSHLVLQKHKNHKLY